MNIHVTNKELASYIAGILPARTRNRIESHIHECGPCRARYEQLLSAIAPRYQGFEVSDHLWERIMRSWRDIRNGAQPDAHRFLPARRPGLVAASVFAVAAIVLVIAGFLLLGPDEPRASSLVVDMTEREVLVDGKAARKGDPVRKGTVVNLVSGSAARLIFNTSIRIDIAGKADMVVDKFTADTAYGVNMAISLREGTLVSSIQGGEAPVVYEYVTPAARIAPLGTEFLLQASGGATLVIVKEGGILVTSTRTGEQFRVSAGGKCIISDTTLSMEASGQDLGIFSDVAGLRAGAYAHLLLPAGIGQKVRSNIKAGTTEHDENPSVRDDDNAAVENRAIRERIEHENSREIIRQRTEESRMQMNEMRRNSRMNMNQQKMRGR